MDIAIQPDPKLTRQQWQQIVGYYAALGLEVYFLEPHEAIPDQCFTANVAWVYEKKIFLANFLHRERHLERLIAAKWFSNHEHPLVRNEQLYFASDIPGDVVFEGGGDATSIPGGPILLGFGHRTQKRAAAQIGRHADVQTIALKLADPRFYHLDTCLMVIPAIEKILYYPDAFDDAARARLQRLSYELMPMSEEDAMRFVANGFPVGLDLVVNEPTKSLIRDLEREGMTLRVVDTSEFMKSGGSVRCLTLPIA